MTKMTRAQVADLAADAVALSKEHADRADAIERVRGFPLDMAQITCPDCRRDAYPDSLGEAIDWALSHRCGAEEG